MCLWLLIQIIILESKHFLWNKWIIPSVQVLSLNSPVFLSGSQFGSSLVWKGRDNKCSLPNKIRIGSYLCVTYTHLTPTSWMELVKIESKLLPHFSEIMLLPVLPLLGQPKIAEKLKFCGVSLGTKVLPTSLCVFPFHFSFNLFIPYSSSSFILAALLGIS